MPRKQIQARSQVRRTQQNGKPRQHGQCLPRHPDNANTLCCRPSPFVVHNNFGGGFGGCRRTKVTSKYNSFVQRAMLSEATARSLVSPTQPAPCVAPRVPMAARQTVLCLQCLTRTESHSQPCALAHPHQQVRLTDVAGQRCCQHQASSAGQPPGSNPWQMSQTLHKGLCWCRLHLCERGLCWACCCCLQEPHSSSQTWTWMTAAMATVRAGLGQRPLLALKHPTRFVRRGCGTASVWSTDSSNRVGTTSTNSLQARGKAARPCWDLSAATAGACAAVCSTLTCVLCLACRAPVCSLRVPNRQPHQLDGGLP